MLDLKLNPPRRYDIIPLARVVWAVSWKFIATVFAIAVVTAEGGGNVLPSSIAALISLPISLIFFTLPSVVLVNAASAAIAFFAGGIIPKTIVAPGLSTIVIGFVSAQPSMYYAGMLRWPKWIGFLWMAALIILWVLELRSSGAKKERIPR